MPTTPATPTMPTAGNVANLIIGFISDASAEGDLDLDGVRSWVDLARIADTDMILSDALDTLVLDIGSATGKFLEDIIGDVTEWLADRDNRVNAEDAPITNAYATLVLTVPDNAELLFQLRIAIAGALQGHEADIPLTNWEPDPDTIADALMNAHHDDDAVRNSDAWPTVRIIDLNEEGAR